MLLLLLYATVGMLGLLILFVINFNYRKQTQVSQYMQCLILVHSARFLMYAVLVTLNVPATHHFLSLTDVVVGLSFPLVYLYFRNLTEHFSFDRKAALHLIIPGFFLLIIAVLNNTTTRFEKEGQMLLTVWVLVLEGVGEGVVEGVVEGNAREGFRLMLLHHHQQNKKTSALQSLLTGNFHLILRQKGPIRVIGHSGGDPVDIHLRLGERSHVLLSRLNAE